MKTKRKYGRPQMLAVELREMPQLLAGSNPKSTLNVTYEEEDI